MNRVLITGGAGFIGSHLAEELVRRRGTHVRILDNFDPFYDVAIKRRNLERVAAVGEMEFVQGDLRDPAACRAATDGVDGIIHLAALAGVRPSIQRPADYMAVNVTGTQNLLDAVRERPMPFVFGSSSSVYGGNKKVPFSEADPVDEPVSPYAASKKSGELICHAFHHLHGHPLTCLRFFTVYGPRQRPEMAIHKFARMILSGAPLTMFGDGSSRRDYTFVSDIVAGIIAAFDRAAGSTQAGFNIYNLGGSATTSLKELIVTIERVLGKRAILEVHPDQPGDVPQTWADSQKAAQELGWEAQVPVADGIARFCNWYLEERKQGSVG